MISNTNRLVWPFLVLANLTLSNVWWIHWNLPPTKEEKADSIPVQPNLRLPQVDSFQPIPLEAFVISLDHEGATSFLSRNNKVGLKGNNVTGFPAWNGYDQGVLDEFATLTGFPALRANKMSKSEWKAKRGYDTPNHVGCFMSHWDLVRSKWMAWEEDLAARPETMFVFEEDATCVENAVSTTLEIVKKLPSDWDLLFIGGKPFSFHTNGATEVPVDLKDYETITTKSIPHRVFRDLVCRGVFGNSTTGPFAPNGSRRLSLSQPYWQTRYISNTHAFVVNPSRIEKILQVLETPTHEFQVPVDIALAEAMERGELKAFMTTKEYCIQGAWPKDKKKEPNRWKGMYHYDQLEGFRYEDIFMQSCPNKI